MTKKTIEVGLDFYKVYKCGYYEFRSPSAKFGGLQSTLEQLKEWVKGKTLGDTKLWDNLKESNKSDGLPVYILGIESNQDSYVVCVWNEVLADSDNRVGAASKDDNVGDVEVTLKKFGVNEIPGYPTYFWFMPSKNRFATLRFPGRNKTLQPKLEQYIKAFLTYETQEAVYEEQETDDNKQVADDDQTTVERRLVGYRKNDSDDPDDGLEPRYDVGLLKKTTDIKWLIDNADKVGKLHCKSSLSKQNRAHSNFFYNRIRDALDFLNWSLDDVPTRANLKTSFTVEVTGDQVEKIIKKYDEETAWDDYGFQLKSDSEIHWLSGKSVKEKQSLELKVNESGIIDLPTLLAVLTKRQKLLSIMKE